MTLDGKLWAVKTCLVLVAACSASPTGTTKPTTAEVPRVEVLVGSGAALRWYEVSGAGVREIRSAQLPTGIERQLVWHAGAPAFLLQDERVATATAKGIEIIALPPAKLWDGPPPMEGMQKVDIPSVRLFERDGGLWLGKCQWTASVVDCTEWVNVRLRPEPPIVTTDAYEEPPAKLPKVAPSSTTKVALVPDTEREAPADGSKRMKLVCTENGKTIEDPPKGAPAAEPHEFQQQPYYGRYDLVWLQTDPPIFQVGTDSCAPCPRSVIFEGCVQSRFDHVTLGPSDVLAFDSYRDSVRSVTFKWHGKTLGTLTDVDEMSFVPR